MDAPPGHRPGAHRAEARIGLAPAHATAQPAPVAAAQAGLGPARPDRRRASRLSGGALGIHHGAPRAPPAGGGRVSRNPPAVSVVIPTRDRSEVLRRTLDALARQTVPAEAMEVIVVADGCTDDTTTWLRGYRPRYRLRCGELPHSGPAAARNAGAAAAAGEILLFLDDDIEPAPGFVAEHLRSHEGSAAVVAIGPCPPIAPGRQDFWRVLFRRW